uniref:RING-type E3 ubiquitin transferase n=1 Tax=Cymbidium sinense TaxID=112615 RepID=A0A513X4V6_9ASPA|nr:RING-H2 finger protein ATL54-like isoform X1 [Cymbidium sinense]
MALRRRILIFTKSENSSVCTHDCYAFPSPPLSRSSPLSSGESISRHHLLANIIIAAISVTSAVLFLVLMYYAVLIRRRRRRSDLPAGGNGGSLDLENGVADYHVWHVCTVGLDESAIHSIPTKPYVAGVGTAADCAVCLGDFYEGELVRFLPACGHAFHVLCIDTWLRAHISCPLCRANIIDPDITAASEEGEFGSVVRVLDELQEDEGADVNDAALDCIESSTLGDRGGMSENVSGEEWRSDSMGSFLASDLSFRLDREERYEDGGILNRAKQTSDSSEERQQKKH